MDTSSAKTVVEKPLVQKQSQKYLFGENSHMDTSSEKTGHIETSSKKAGHIETSCKKTGHIDTSSKKKLTIQIALVRKSVT